MSSTARPISAGRVRGWWIAWKSSLTRSILRSILFRGGYLGRRGCRLHGGAALATLRRVGVRFHDAELQTLDRGAAVVKRQAAVAVVRHRHVGVAEVDVLQPALGVVA